VEDLYKLHLSFLTELESTFTRHIASEISWDERLLLIRGSRGIGKTTLIGQYIFEKFRFSEKALYVSMDNLVLGDRSLYYIANEHFKRGGTHLFIDEIHKYSNWSQELKNCYDSLKKLKIVASGSSILHLHKGNADLSRRAITYELKGLSFREFLNIELDQNFPVYTLEDINKNSVEIAHSIVKKINPLEYFKNYLSYGYYPFYLEGTKNFGQKLNATINQTIEFDIPLLYNLELSSIEKLRKLLYHLATSVPFQPNSSKLAQSLDISRQTLNSYLQYMEEAQILKLLWNSAKAYSLISKPEKIYLHNPNICHLIPQSVANIGNVRETFFINQVSAVHQVSHTQKGDFLVNDQMIFEVGGENKKFKQIAGIKNSYLAVDNEMMGTQNRIPLWLFGFLY
jgi:hypothetical protein